MRILQKIFLFLVFMTPLIVWAALFFTGHLYAMKITDGFIARINMLPIMVIIQSGIAIALMRNVSDTFFKKFVVTIAVVLIVFSAFKILDERRSVLTQDDLKNASILLIINEKMQDILNRLEDGKIDLSAYESCFVKPQPTHCDALDGDEFGKLLSGVDINVLGYGDVRKLFTLSMIKSDMLIADGQFNESFAMMSRSDEVANAYVERHSDVNLLLLITQSVKEINLRHIKMSFEAHKDNIPKDLKSAFKNMFTQMATSDLPVPRTSKEDIIVTYQLYFLTSLGVNSNRYFNHEYATFGGMADAECDDLDNIQKTPFLLSAVMKIKGYDDMDNKQMISADFGVRCNIHKNQSRIRALELNID